MTKGMAWPKANPGAMSHRIQLQLQSTEADVFGQQRQVWSTVLTTWASIEPVSGTNVIQSGQETNQLFLTITIFWQRGVRADMRVLTEDGETYIIQSIEDLKRLHSVLVLNCLQLRAEET